MDEVIETIDELTPEWLTAALHAAGLDCAVDAVASTAIGTGQIGSTYRLDIEYSSGADDAPRTLVAKMAAGDAAARQRVAGGYQKEVGFYATIAPTVDVRTPRCWYGAISDDNTNFVLLLDDLAGATPGVQADGCTLARAQSSLANLAALHAPRWNDPALLTIDYLSRGMAEMGELLQSVLVGATEEFCARYEQQLGAEDIETMRQSASAIGAWYTARPTPFTICHGDYRLDNLMFDADDGVTALDWQTADVGPPGRDLAYFIGTCLEPELRREHQHDLVAGYHAELVGRGVRDHDLADCLADYRFGQLQGPFITVLGCMYATSTPTERSDQMFLAMARRSCAAIRDLDSLGSIWAAAWPVMGDSEPHSVA